MAGDDGEHMAVDDEHLADDDEEHIAGNDEEHMASDDEENLFEFLLAFLHGSGLLYIILSGLLGLLVAFWNPALGNFSITFLTCLSGEYLDSSFQSSSIKFLTNWLALTAFGYATSLFSYLSMWHFSLLLPSMIQYIQGTATDIQFTHAMAKVEWQIYFYFGPTVFGIARRLLWANIWTLTMVSAAVAGVWFLIPVRTRTLFFWTGVLKLFLGFGRYGFSIRSCFKFVYQELGTRFDSWEIGIARSRQGRSISSPEAYGYQKLESSRHIRLLSLKRRSFFNPPVCELIHVSLDECPDYEAISYTWGERDPYIPVEIGGQGFVLVTATVDELLFYRRSIFGDKLFWIDAVCINQKDNIERAKQIPLMFEIYQNSARVLVWLGPPTNDIKASRMLCSIVNATSGPNLTDKVSSRDLLDYMFAEPEVAVRLLGEFLSHPWFERIWIVQEVAAGKKVHIMYNGFCLDWDYLAMTTARIEDDIIFRQMIQVSMSPNTSTAGAQASAVGLPFEGHGIGRMHWSNARFMGRVRQSLLDKEPFSLGVLVLLTAEFKAKEPRDKVFALLGIAADGDEFTYQPNYEDPEEVVFLETTRFLLSSEYWFPILAMVGSGYEYFLPPKDPPPSGTNPSWAMDFARPRIIGARAPRADLRELRDVNGTVSISPEEPKTLHLQLVNFDTITDSRPPLKMSSDYPLLYDSKDEDDTLTTNIKHFLTNANKVAREWYTTNRALARTHLTNSQDAIDQDFWDLCMHASSAPTNPSFPHKTSPASRAIFEFFLLTPADTLLAYTSPTICGYPVTEAIEVMRLLGHSFMKGVGGKAVCVTASGQMALVPPGARAGDGFVHIRGGFAPGLVRAVEGEKNTAEWVGTCYVHGVEDVYGGAGWEEWKFV
ncbi:hypothetical protein ACEPPN_018891 [Leptodophora sp. 'Broadleaf-Isolate-01']